MRSASYAEGSYEKQVSSNGGNGGSDEDIVQVLRTEASSRPYLCLTPRVRYHAAYPLARASVRASVRDDTSCHPGSLAQAHGRRQAQSLHRENHSDAGDPGGLLA